MRDVPEELSCLRYIEKLLVQHVCVNGCFIHVASSGMKKMVAHAVAFESPVAKLYHSCKGNLTIKHNAQILARGIQSILDKYNTAEGCIPCKGNITHTSTIPVLPPLSQSENHVHPLTTLQLHQIKNHNSHMLLLPSKLLLLLT